MNKWAQLKKIYTFVKPYRVTFLNLFACILITSFIGMLYPYIFATLIDEVFYHRNMEFFKIIVLSYGVIYIGEASLHLVLNSLWAYLMTRFLFDIRRKVFEKILCLKAKFLSDSKTGELIARVNNDTNEFMNLIHWNIFYLTANVMRLIISIVLVTVISYKLSLLMFVLIPLSVYATLYFGHKNRDYFKAYRKEYGNGISWLSELVRGMREVKLLATERNVTKEFVHIWSHLIRLKVKTNMVSYWSSRVIALISLLSDLSLYAVAGVLVVKGELTVGGFVAAIEYFSKTNSLLKNLNEKNQKIQKNMVSIDRVFALLSEETEESNRKLLDLQVTVGQIELRQVSFAYNPENLVLRDVNLIIQPGEHLSIVGRSGAGKSTLAGLLLRLYDPVDGEIRIDGKQIREYSLKSLRNHIGMVQQETLIFNGTIRYNLRLGNPKAKDTEIWQACEKASIADVIRNLPQGLDTIIGTGGINLSGGQRQRIAIARIFLKNPKILIFDEATSALDFEAEQAVKQAWKELSQDRTSIIIAHRLSTILDSDRVAVLEGGQIVGCDHHLKLLEYCPAYKKLFGEQYLGEKEGELVG